MEERNKYLKYIFSIECLLGTSVVSYKTIGQKPEHRVFRYVWSVFLVLLLIFDAFYNLKKVNAAIEAQMLSFTQVYIHRFVRDVYLLYTSIMALYDEDRRLYAALNLDAIEVHLRELNITLPGASAETSVLVILGIVYLLHLGEVVTLMLSLFFRTVSNPLYNLGMILYIDSVKCSQMFGCILLLTRCLRIQQALSDKLDKLGLQCEEEELPVVFVVQRRVAWAEGSEDRQRVLTTTMAAHNALVATEREVKSCYRVLLVWITFVAAVYSPSLTLLYTYKRGLEAWGLAASMMVYPAFCMAVAVIHSTLQFGKQSMEEKLAKLLRTDSQEEHIRSIRHQLRTVNSVESFNCGLFDVDYTLMATILETTLMIVCTMLNTSF